MNKYIQHDGGAWEVIAQGVQRDGKTHCHLASLTDFQSQQNGAFPVQITDDVNDALLADCYAKWRLIEIVQFLRMKAGYPPSQSGFLHDLTREQLADVIWWMREDFARA